MFTFLKNAFYTIRATVSRHLNRIFSREHVDEETLKELEKTLLEADTGVQTAREIMSQIRERARHEQLSGHDVKEMLRHELFQRLSQYPYQKAGRVYMLVGINGSGKTSCAGKLAWHFHQRGYTTLLAAADTFRAAATQQLAHYAETYGISCVTGADQQDPASIVYTACKRYVDEQFDVVIIDTAGRLHTKKNLMGEMSKMIRVAQKHISRDEMSVLLTVDAFLGQNSYDQARLFHENTHVDGVVLTKMDATAKGGIVFSITRELHVPIAYTTFGERPDAMAPFDAQAYVNNLLDA